MTAFARSPVEGYWKPGKEGTRVDDVIILEVMSDDLDRDWWGALLLRLERTFQQKEIVIRSHVIHRL